MADNFKNEKEYTEFREVYYGKCIESNNTKTILLTFDCANFMISISRSEKANMIRNYYID